jgi:hypothetical protein
MASGAALARRRDDANDDVFLFNSGESTMSKTTQTMRCRLMAMTCVLSMAAVAAGQTEDTNPRRQRDDSAPPQRDPAAGPLRVHPTDPRYFTDGTKDERGTLQAVYLTGTHTWNNLVDMGRGHPPETFDFDAYLDFLERHNHNFIRLWAWDSFAWDTRANASQAEAGKLAHHVSPLPWARTGPGKALDDQPQFDLTQFDPAYFERLRARVSAAGRRGTYVSVMLFEGWGMYQGNRRQTASIGWAWRSHPFHPDNNCNGIDAGGDAATGGPHRLGNKAVNAAQEAYIRKVVDTVNDLDNVLYEVINEGGAKEWDWWVAKTVQEYERTKPKQHPVGITGHGAENVADMLASPADWISPGKNDGFGDDPPAWDGKKVSVLDTDHIWGVGGNAAWARKVFLRGHNPIFMDPYDNRVLGKGQPDQWNDLRRSLGHTRRLAERVDLATMTPRDDLASTKYCLARPGVAYIVYLPDGGDVAVNLSDAPGSFRAEWIHATEGTIARAEPVNGGRQQTLKAPFPGSAVLYLRTQ